ncbi:mandelate racemase/muconate lactonizing enzyme family protein [Hufsiella ginkgonis]|uniref:Dipeptide epimerase n=1 Tax=Hufsiella ginkgonis TaxID=2695274 RepID=A0A7K1XXK3_9SPHI|nr:dipeptide epimerase [Hufsiella ginkgonis]MXV15567.1 dipeptide epimerase [Hufsiella ginkgonis]
MLITHIEIYRFSIKMHPFVIATGTMFYAQNVFIRVYTNQGFYGVGECSAFPMIVGETQDTCLAMAKDFAALWKGKDPLDIPARMQELHDFTAGNATIKSAFDMALYDIAAKAENQPLYRFLGGARRTIETDITVGIAAAGEMAAKAAHFIEMGATKLKIKLGKNAAQDINRVKAIRQSVGEAPVIRIDANQGWDFEDAATALKGMEPYNIQFCEQPMRKWNDHRLAELRRATAIKIMADESCFDHHDAGRLAAAEACDYINIKFSKSGGILEALKIHELSKKAGIPCMIGGMLESRIALSAKLHFAYACSGIVFHDMDTCMLGHLEDPCEGGIRFSGFLLDIEDTPGIGADANEAFLQKCEKIVI